MNLRAGMGGMVLLAALLARAGEQGAPLEQSKEELKALQKEQHAAPGGEGAMGQLREAMPQIQSPLLGTTTVDPALRKDSEAERKKKKAVQKNWLLDGMDKLDKNPKNKGDDDKDKLIESKDDSGQPANDNQPASLLQLYSEQQKKDEAKVAARQSPAGRADPFAPFLQGWLVDSPVRGKFFDESIKKPDATPVDGTMQSQTAFEGNAGPGSLGLDAGVPGSRNASAAVSAQANNPYLQGLDLSALREAGPDSQLPAPLPVFQAGGPATPAGSLIDPVPAAPPPDKKAPPSALSDDKKYFPQMKKF